MNRTKAFSPVRRIAPRRRAFTLVEVMIVVGITGVVVAIAAPTWFRQRALSQQRSCQETMTKIDSAKEQWAMENSQTGSMPVVEEDLWNKDKTGYVKQRPICPAGGTYDYQTVSEPTLCDIADPLVHNDRPQ